MLGAAALMAGTASLASCNKDKDSDLYLDPVNLAVKSFTLNGGIADQELDTVFFSIDLERRLIFNADSLRKGTDISKVVANITFDNTPSEAVIVMQGGTTREGEIDYRENPTDSIDFTGNVTLRLKSDNDKIGTTYRIKVNVHNIDSDSLYWSEASVAALPSRMPNPMRQKTVEHANNAISIIQEADASYTLAKSDGIDGSGWSKTKLELPFSPEIESLTATSSNLWMLASDGSLYSSDIDGSGWTHTGQTWRTLIGRYNETVVGLRNLDGSIVFAQYPMLDLLQKEAPADFPVSGLSNFVTLSNQWTSSPVAFFSGGRKTDGTLSDRTWAFDGANWITLSQGGLPQIEGAAIIPYYNYRPSASGDYMVQYKVWMLIGGRLSDGKFNRTVYVSYDNAVNWTKAADSVQLPDCIPTMTGCDAIVAETDMQANLSDMWKSRHRTATRAGWTLEGDVISWGCPYIYLFGGYAPDGTLYNTIWRGVLSRLTFTPII